MGKHDPAPAIPSTHLAHRLRGPGGCPEATAPASIALTMSARSSSSIEASPSLETTYVHLRDDRSAVPIPLTPTLWPELTSNRRPELLPGRLGMVFSFTESWPTWEIHPSGDELVVLLEGRARLVLEATDGERTIALERPGEFVLVPRGTWHTARIDSPCRMLFLTPGEGTENRPVDAGTSSALAE